MQIPHYFEIFLMLLVASTIAINGWHLSTEGHEQKMPDGTIKRTGNIFRSWYFFWMQEHKWKKLYQYKADALVVIVAEIEMFLNSSRAAREADPRMGGVGIRVNVNNDGDDMIAVNQLVADKISLIERQFGIVIESVVHGPLEGRDQYLLRIYKAEEDYVFPWWLRKMMATCITCHASLYGTLIFVVFHLAISRSQLTSFYSIFPNLYAGILLTWLAYTLSLAYTLTFAYKKNK